MCGVIILSIAVRHDIKSDHDCSTHKLFYIVSTSFSPVEFWQILSSLWKNRRMQYKEFVP